ncbi:MAG TPA: mechanosensitive ion channel domain-containing protein [Syntrophales bacterium]|nr:mechanosensitive ion channel domain-containing protein [Syntrophales bacterium]
MQQFKFRRLHALLILAVSVVLSVPALTNGAAEPKTAAPVTSPAPASSPVIPVPDIATRAMEVSNTLRAFSIKLAPSPEIEAIRKQLPGVSRTIDQQLAETRRIILEEASLETLQSQQQLWEDLQHKTDSWLNAITIRATQIQDALNQLAELKKTWTLTRDAARASNAPGPILQQIDATLATLQAAQAPLQSQDLSLLDIQGRIAADVERCGNALVQIAEAQHATVGGILMRSSPPIWSEDFRVKTAQALTSVVPQRIDAYSAVIIRHLQDPSRGLTLFGGVVAVLVLLMSVARRQVARWKEGDEALSSATQVFDRPYAAALMGSLILASGPMSPAPPEMKQLFEILSLVPMIRLIRPMIYPPLSPLLFVLGGLFTADAIRQILAGAPNIGQGILVLEGLAGVAMMGWFLRAGQLRRLPSGQAGLSRSRVLEAVALYLLLVFAAGGVAASLGYLRLARLLAPGIIVGSVLALSLYALLRVARGVIAFALRVWPLRQLRMVLHHRDFLERRIYRLLVWIAVVVCISRYLNYLGLLDPTVTSTKEMLAARLGTGTFSTSLGDILAFFAAVWAAYLLSSLIRFVLEEDIYPRISLPTGLSYATSSLLNYIILAIGFVVAMALLGVNLTQVTVLAGAFGVGIGFGLQSVVNNFVSGLILLFERPIHVGDTIEVGALLGVIRRIGIRASTVRTWQGADIIVPNAQLITENVTNWTLSDRLRRIDLPVGVNYSAQPHEVIRILETVALANPNILHSPPPQGLMMGYGDSSINFELRAWTDEFDNWPAVRSELAVALYDAVHAAGMTFPFPQREVRLLPNPGPDSP